PYANMLREMLANVAEAASQNPDSSHPLLSVREENRVLAIVVTADRGLAGGFNANLIKLAQRFWTEHHTKELTFEVIGRKARDYFRRRSAKITGEYLDLFRNVKFEDATRIADVVIDRFSKGEVDAVYLFVNEFKNAATPSLVQK